MAPSTRAAERLFMTQPAVTFQIKQLEEHFLTPASERGMASSVTLAGEIVFDYASVSSPLNEGTRITRVGADRRARRHAQRGYFSTTIAAYWLPHLLEGFSASIRG